jgi:hypothetical protein
MGCFGAEVRCPKCGCEFDVRDGREELFKNQMKKLNKLTEKMKK